MKRIGIIGSGSWSLALSKIINCEKLIIKIRTKSNIQRFNKKKVFITKEFQDLESLDCIFLAIPSQALRENLVAVKRINKSEKTIFVICSKGVEKKTNYLMSEVLKKIVANPYVILSGPNFSFEVIKGLPTASVLSSEKSHYSKKISRVFKQEKFRTYFNNDVIGTQVGGAMKNVIAIACGLIRGKRLGTNAIASVLSRGLSEIVELGYTMGAEKRTFYGLSGLGDLALTCSSLRSRNTYLGFVLGKKGTFSKKTKTLVEGFESCESVCNLGIKHGVELPICNSVKKVLHGANIDKVINELLSRPLQFEK